MRAAALNQPDIRDRILAVAEQLFRAQGYAKTTVADIARECEMSPANVYRFYESKAAINEAITGVLLKRCEDMCLAVVSERRSATERVRRLILECHAFACEQFLKDNKVHEIVIKALNEQWAVIDAHSQRIWRLFASLVEQGIAGGEFTTQDVATAADCLFNTMWGLCHPQIVAERLANDRGRQAAALADFVIRALKAPLNHG